MSEPVEIPPLDAALTRADCLRLVAGLEANPPAHLRPVTLAVLATFTADLLRPWLVVECARRGIALKWRSTPYGQVEQQIIDPASELYAANPEAIIILLRLADLAPAADGRFLSLDVNQAGEERGRLTQWMAQQLQTLRSRTGAVIMVSNFTPPEVAAAGLADGSLIHSQAGWVHSVNLAMAEVCAAVPRTSVLDVARIAVETGMHRWRDDRLAFMAKAPLSGEALAALARLSARSLRAAAVPPKKCLVLDMDNTLWGGVVGEAGIEGIALGPDYPGNVFMEFQRRILSLRDRGVLLAAASKNNPADVEAVFAEHPSCLLRREHFSAFEVHWEDKAVSLRRVARALNIGLDALVFFDDNPVERAWVREQLPAVTVIEAPTSPMGYWKALDDSGCFDSLTLTNEDRQRAGMYAQEEQRKALQSSAGSLEDFLRSLDLVLTVGRIDESTLPRVAQLLAKTNQFNLTTRRHDEAAIREMSGAGAGLWVRVRDRFGDAGLVGVVIAVPADAGTWRIDTLLMSCRVIGRRVETAMLGLLERAAAQRGVHCLHGEFVPSLKNQPASGFLPDHGFVPNGEYWKLMFENPRALPDYFRFEDHSGIPLL
ncbi:MAG TPA: HAD-IIIC family phosphatase [Verrucomicrobiales bacterium]|nr:HAD-IIIC family phosphatase [Verrucomicrobiales bacterium]